VRPAAQARQAALQQSFHSETIAFARADDELDGGFVTEERVVN
jgi:hypothetical protein